MAHSKKSSVAPRRMPVVKHERFMDVPSQVNHHTNPIDGYQRLPIMTITDAIKPIQHLITNLNEQARHARNTFASQNLGDLVVDQAAAIKLYTVEGESHDQSLYFVLNKSLRDGDRSKLQPWFGYLKLLLTGLFRVPSISGTIFRGIKLDLRAQYPVGSDVIWWGISSCTDKLNVLESEQFLGGSGPRTLFIIQCFTGKNITKYSSIASECEIILLPGTTLKVTGCLKQQCGLSIIDLKETPSAHILLQHPGNGIDSMTNPQIEHLLSEQKNKEIDFSEKQLQDCDVIYLCQQLMLDTSYNLLDLSSNRITIDGAQSIRCMLQHNRTLQSLNLHDNQLNDFGVAAIAQGLDGNNTLTQIILSKNQLNDQGVHSLAQMLRYNRTISHVNLSSNNISDEGVGLLMELLVHQHYLRKLFLHMNKATDKIVPKVVSMLAVNHSLESLYLDDNQISDQGKERIRLTVLSRNDLVLSL